MSTAATIIESKGGAASVALVLKRKPGLVRVWKHRNYFPRAVWPDLLSAYPDLTMDALRATEAAQAKSPPTSTAVGRA